MTRDHFPRLEKFRTAEFDRLGYIARWVSSFDHWLSEEEASSSRLMFHDLATASGLHAEYGLGEAKLVRFYSELLRDGAICRAISREDESLVVYPDYDAALAERVLLSLREKDMMDCYVPRLSAASRGASFLSSLALVPHRLMFHFPTRAFPRLKVAAAADVRK